MFPLRRAAARLGCLMPADLVATPARHRRGCAGRTGRSCSCGLWAVGAQGGLRRGPGWVLAAAAEGMRWGCGCSRPGAAKPRKRAGKGLGQCLSCCQCSGDVTPVSFKLGTQDFALGCMLLPRAKCELWGRVCQSKA